MDSARGLLQQDKFQQCLDACEQEIKFLTTADKKLPFHLLASQAALKLHSSSSSSAADTATTAALDKAKQHAEWAVKLDNSKMACWQALYDALTCASSSSASTDNSKRIATVLSTQAKIAQRNGNGERASAFARQAAEQYERVGELALAAEHWQDAIDQQSSPELVRGLALCFELQGDTLQADKCWWDLLQSESELLAYEAALRLLSRPSHVVLEAKRTGQTEHIRQQEQGAWHELANRLARISGSSSSSSSSPLISQLVFACRQRLEMTLADEDEALGIVLLRSSGDQAVEFAVQARAWFLLGKLALHRGDPQAGLRCIELAEELEQRVYAKFSSSSSASNSGGRVIIGTEFIIRAFTGHEVLSLVCGKTAETVQLKARCLLALLPGGVRQALRLADRVLASPLLQDGGSNDDGDVCRLLHKLSRASYPFVVAKEKTGGDASPASALYAFDRAQLEQGASSSWYDRRMRSLLLPACVALQFELLDVPAPPSPVPPAAALTPYQPVRDALPTPPLSVDADDYGQVFCDSWALRLAFSTSPGAAFPVERAVAVLAADGNLPLVCELLGKHYMGLDGGKAHFHSIPQTQPDRKRVRDPARAVKFLQQAAHMDAAGLGCVAPLANALHAAQQEDKARQLYESALAASAGGDVPLLVEWAHLRLGQHHQLKLQQPVLAANSFQRALAVRTSATASSWVVLSALCGLGEANASMGRVGAATQNLERALALCQEQADGNDPTLAVAIEFKLAQLLAGSGHTLLALDRLTRLDADAASSSSLGQAIKQELAECQLERARYLLTRGAVGEAKQVLHQSYGNFAAQTGGGGGGFKGLGDVCGELRQWANASRWYAKACHAAPWDSLARYDLARALLAQQQEQLGDAAAATRCCEAAVVLDPADAQAWNLLGQCRVQHDVYVAQHCFIRSLQLAPDSLAAPWLNLGWTLLKGGGGGKLALAKRAFSQAQTIDPDSCQAWLGHFKCGQGDDAAALQCAVDAVKYNALDDAAASTALLLLGEVLVDRHSRGDDEDWLVLLDVSARASQQLKDNKNAASGLLLQARAHALQGYVQHDARAYELARDAFLAGGDVANSARMALNRAVLCGDRDGGDSGDVYADESGDYLHALGRWQLRQHDDDTERALVSLERAVSEPAASPLTRLTRQLDWLEAIVACPGYDAEFATEVARAWAEEAATTTALTGGELVARLAALADGQFIEVLSPDQRLGLDARYGVWREPWKVQAWARLGGGGGVVAARTVLLLAEQQQESGGAGGEGDDWRAVFNAGKTWLEGMQESDAAVPAAPSAAPTRHHYWTHNSAASLRLKLKHLAPWEVVGV